MLYAVAMLASVALVLVNAFFVAAEFAIVKIRPSRLEQLAARGQRRARVALGIARRLDTAKGRAIFPTFTWRDRSGSLGVAGKVASPKGGMRLIVG
jgi:Cyclin M transmembrane N-terminal domain